MARDDVVQALWLRFSSVCLTQEQADELKRLIQQRVRRCA